MPIEVLFSDLTFTLGVLGKNEPIKYGIVSERSTTKLDVVVLRNVPLADKDTVAVPDPEGGWTEALKLRKKLSVLTGNVVPGGTSAIYILDNPKTLKELESERIAGEIMNVANRMIAGEIGMTNNIVQVDGLSFKILRFKPPTSREDFDVTMMYLYMLVAGRKRIMISSPAFVEVVIDNDTHWCVTSIPRVLPYLWEAPGELVASGLVDPGGFNAPFIVVRNVSWKDLLDVKKQLYAVKWVSLLMSQTGAGGKGSTTTATPTVGGIGAEGEEVEF